jgi:CBS domain-containing protein
MNPRTKPLRDLTAGDLMTRDVVRLSHDLPLREAIRLLLQNQVGGAPVVDAEGRCVGVFSATDVLRLGLNRPDVLGPPRPPLPITCPFQARGTGPGGQEVTLCALPLGVCPIQVKQPGPGGKELVVCSQPRCMLTDWQVVDVEQLPTDEVSQFMTGDLVRASPDTPIRVLARMMIDAHIHRVIVVDEAKKPVGIVSSTDLLAVLAYTDAEQGSGVLK